MIYAKIQAGAVARAIEWRTFVFSALLAVCALAGGCASSRHVPPPYELGRAPASELVGLTQDEMVQRLGGQPSGEFYANRVSLEDGGRVSSIALSQLGRDSCPRNFFSFVTLQPPPDVSQMAFGVFRQERLAGLTDSNDRALSLDVMVVMSCVGRPREEMDPDAGALWVLYAPLFVIAAPAIAVTAADASADAQRRRELWASVRLGEPLPNGAEGFVEAYDNGLRIERNGRDVRISDYGGFSITLRDDRVLSIDRRHVRCRLMPDASLDCER